MDFLLTLPDDIHLPGTPEHFTALLTSDSGLLVERIVSWGHVTPEGQWYDQEKDEWVLLEAEILGRAAYLPVEWENDGKGATKPMKRWAYIDDLLPQEKREG